MIAYKVYHCFLLYLQLDVFKHIQDEFAVFSEQELHWSIVLYIDMSEFKNIFYNNKYLKISRFPPTLHQSGVYI